MMIAGENIWGPILRSNVRSSHAAYCLVVGALAAHWSKLSYFSGGDAYQPVLFQVALGALHIDVLVGRKLGADPIIRSGKGLDVHATPGFKNSFQIFAD